jgi:hypothetical protein
MPSRILRSLFIVLASAVAFAAFGQPGLRVPERGEPGIDPAFARGWLAPDFDRFGFASSSQRTNWSYSFGERASLGLSMGPARDIEYDQRQLSLFGRYWFAQDWAVSAENLSREANGLLKLNDFRIGVQRRF